MTGFVHVIVPESRFRLAEGAERLTSYTLQHRRRRAPVLRGLRREELLPAALQSRRLVGQRPLPGRARRRSSSTIEAFDGQNWEAHDGAGAGAPEPRRPHVTDILMPALSPTMEEGTLAKWHVKVGDTVKSGDVIAEIETDKATMEVEAVDEGVVEEILVPEGTEGREGQHADRAAGGGRRDAAAAAPPSRPKSDTRCSARRSREAEASAQNAKRRCAAASSHRSRPQRRADGEAQTASASSPRRWPAGSPQQKGVDLAAVKGSGPHGRIVKARRRGRSAGPGQGPRRGRGRPRPRRRRAPRQVQSLEQMGIAPGSYDLVPLDGMRKTVARRMTESFRDVPHFPLTIDLEIDALLAARAKINAMLEKSGVQGQRQRHGHQGRRRRP